jgi:hypothetical protein
LFIRRISVFGGDALSIDLVTLAEPAEFHPHGQIQYAH